MKRIIRFFLAKAVSAALAASSLSAGAAYNKEAGISLEEEKPLSWASAEGEAPAASKAVLSYKGSPVCVTGASEDITPSFIKTAASDWDDDSGPALPNCNEEEKDIISYMAQNAAQADKKGGIDIAGAPVALFICGAGAAAGAFAKIIEAGAEAELQTEETMIPYAATTALAGAPIAASLAGSEAAAVTARGGAFAVSEAAAFAGKTLSYVNSFLKTSAITAACSAGAYYTVSYIMNPFFD